MVLNTGELLIDALDLSRRERYAAMANNHHLEPPSDVSSSPRSSPSATAAAPILRQILSSTSPAVLSSSPIARITEGSTLRDVDMSDLVLEGLSFRRSEIYNCDLSKCTMRSMSWDMCEFGKGTRMRQASVTNVSFCGTWFDMATVEFSETRFSHCMFRGATFKLPKLQAPRPQQEEFAQNGTGKNASSANATERPLSSSWWKSVIFYECDFRNCNIEPRDFGATMVRCTR